jgi:REP element-mobilizing transposase RayT
MTNPSRGTKRSKSEIHSTASSRARRRRRLAKARARSKTRAGPAASSEDTAQPEQLELPKPRRGGKRRGAGRKPKGERAGVSHRTRPDFEHVHPLHVTTRLVCGCPNLRQPGARGVIEACLAIARVRFGMRIIHYSIQRNHLHLLVECVDRRALSKAMQGLLVRFAKNLNKFWVRTGKVFADRYYARELKSLLEIRNAIVYVLRNSTKHELEVDGIDEYSSGIWFDGWERPLSPGPGPNTPVTCVQPQEWPMRVGWKKRYGPIRFDERPRSSGDGERHTAPNPRRSAAAAG